MRRLIFCGGMASLAIGLFISPGRAAEDDTYKSRRRYEQSVLSMWLPFEWPARSDKSAKPEKPKQDDKKAKVTAEKPATPPPEAERLSPLMKEHAKVLRRQEVCDRLAEVARQTNDGVMETQAQLLQQRAWTLYDQRTKGGVATSARPTQEPPATKHAPAKQAAARATPEKSQRGIFAARPKAANGEE